MAQSLSEVELEARFRRALAWHEERGHAKGAAIFASMLDWLLTNRAALKAKS